MNPSETTRDFLVEVADYLRGHGHDTAAQEVLEHVNTIDNDHTTEG